MKTTEQKWFVVGMLSETKRYSILFESSNFDRAMDKFCYFDQNEKYEDIYLPDEIEVESLLIDLN